MLKDLVTRNRSYRRFDESARIAPETLHELVELARLSASGSNRQPLKFYLAWEAKVNALIFPHLGWAGYLKDWGGPGEGERPAGYILILGDTELSQTFGCDHGIAAQSILLGAAERGLGGCMIGTIKVDPLRTALGIPERYKFLLVIALGKPVETVVLETVSADGDIKYWRDAAGVHHVPKRRLEEIILP